MAAGTVREMSSRTDAFVGLLDEALSALREERIRALVIGGVATAILAREPAEWRPRDLELFLLPDQAERAAMLLSEHGFAPGEPQEGWLHSVERDGIAVRLHYRQPGDLYVDEDMIARAVDADFGGVPTPLMSPEDLVVLKVLLHGEDRPSEWWDALALLERPELDWGYLVYRARQYGAQRILSLLCYGRSLDLPVPDEALGSLFAFLEERRAE
jgi:predicted nucleotidyltransferase